MQKQPVLAVTLGVTRRTNSGYNLFSHLFERAHFAAKLLGLGTRLSPPVSVRSAFARARQSLWQRLIFFFSSLLATLIADSLFTIRESLLANAAKYAVQLPA